MAWNEERPVANSKFNCSSCYEATATKGRRLEEGRCLARLQAAVLRGCRYGFHSSSAKESGSAANFCCLFILQVCPVPR